LGVIFKNLDDLLNFLVTNGFEDVADDVALFWNLHPHSDDVVSFEVDMFSEKPKVYAIIKVDIEKWAEELTSDDPA